MTFKKFSKTLGALLVAITALALVGGFVAGGFAPTSFAYAENFAFVADSYGGTQAESLWYFGKDALDVYDAREAVRGWADALKGNEPLIIAVVDTGITAAHEIFDDVLLKNDRGEVMGDNSTVPGGGEVDISDKSDSRHGNAVAGVIAMLIHEFGLEDYIKIYPIKASKKSTVNGKETDTFSIADITEAIRRAHDKVSADVVNFSLGIQYSERKEWATNSELAYEISRVSADSLLVAAAGNNGKKANEQTADGAFYPAALDGIFSVMGYDDEGQLYDGSNYGSIYDIAAPAERIYTATDKYGSESGYSFSHNGTSMAAPMASFAAALLKLRYRAEGLAEPSPIELARTLRSFDFDSVTHDGADIHMLNLSTVVSQPLDEVEPNYSAPTGIKITHDGKLGSGDRADAIFFDNPREVKQINFVADLSPYGMTDPDLNANIDWVLRDEDGIERTLGSGKTLSYTPDVFGATQLIARYRFNSSVESVQKIYVEYLKFVAGDSRVTYEKYANSLPGDAPTSGVLYTGETTVFSFTGANYVDPSVEIKWYVDRQYVASGRTFAYKPTSAGEHIISVQYGDNPPTHAPGVAFVATVKPFILRPLDLSMLIIGLCVAVAAAATLIALYKKRQRELNPPAPKPRKKKEEREEKPDKHIKIAKR